MPDILRVSLLILGELLERGAVTESQPPRVSDLLTSISITADEFWLADSFLVGKGFVDATQGGLSGHRWILAEGIEYYEKSKVQTLPAIQNIFHGPVSNSQIQSVANAVDSVIHQIVGTENLREAISATIDDLVAAVKTDLQGDQFNGYSKIAEELKDEASKDPPSKATLARLIAGLSFLGSVDGVLGFGDRAFDLYQKVAPHIYLLTGYVRKLLG